MSAETKTSRHIEQVSSSVKVLSVESPTLHGVEVLPAGVLDILLSRKSSHVLGSGRSSTIESCFKSVAAEFDRRIRSASLTKICFTSSFWTGVSLFVLRMAHTATLLPLLAL